MNRSAKQGVFCPICNKVVALIAYGGGWVGACCEKIIFNASEMPEHDTEAIRRMQAQAEAGREDLRRR